MARKKKAEKNTEVNPSHMAEGLEQAEQEKPPVFKVSVRNLVAFSIPDDTTWSFTTYFHLQEGTQVHSEIQSRHRTEGAYRSEVYLSYPFETKKCMVEISGRADGVWELEDETIIHEIKTTSAPYRRYMRFQRSPLGPG